MFLEAPLWLVVLLEALLWLVLGSAPEAFVAMKISFAAFADSAGRQKRGLLLLVEVASEYSRGLPLFAELAAEHLPVLVVLG